MIKKLGRSAVGVQVIKNLDFAQQPDDVEESIDAPKQWPRTLIVKQADEDFVSFTSVWCPIVVLPQRECGTCLVQCFHPQHRCDRDRKPFEKDVKQNCKTCKTCKMQKFAESQQYLNFACPVKTLKPRRKDKPMLRLSRVC